MRPKTPVRWLCSRTFDYLARCQGSRLESAAHDQLVLGVELGIMLNRHYDLKEPLCRRRYRTLRGLLAAGPTSEYLRRLRKAERGRPKRGDWQQVQLYRRTVLELSLQYLFELTGLRPRPILVPLCEMIQLIDDVLDQDLDRRLGLPTLVHQRGPSPAHWASVLYGEIRSFNDLRDTPIRWAGGGVYLLARGVCKLR